MINLASEFSAKESEGVRQNYHYLVPGKYHSKLSTSHTQIFIFLSFRSL